MTKMLSVAAIEKSDPVRLIVLVKFEDPSCHAKHPPYDHQEGDRLRVDKITRRLSGHKRLLAMNEEKGTGKGCRTPVLQTL